LISLEIVWALAGAVFGAGGLVMLLRVLKKDVDGLGMRLRNHEERRISDNEDLRTLLLAVCPEKDRKWLAEQLMRR
jgi:hypothetical protein